MAFAAESFPIFRRTPLLLRHICNHHLHMYTRHGGGNENIWAFMQTREISILMFTRRIQERAKKVAECFWGKFAFCYGSACTGKGEREGTEKGNEWHQMSFITLRLSHA